MNPIAIVKFHELALKGKNRGMFLDRLADNLRRATAGAGVRKVWMGQMMVGLTLAEDADWEQVRRRVRDTFGVAKFFRAYRLPRDLDAAEELLGSLLEGRAFGSFRITANRADKRFPVKSMEINRRLGAFVHEKTRVRVDLRHPDLEIFVDVLPREILVYFEEVRGYGGLPVGVSGKLMALLSGGIDSPVAAWHLMKRGARVDFVHFHSYPLVDTTTMEKAEDLVGALTRFQLQSRLFLAPLADIQKRVILTVPPPYRVIFYRRFMLRIAQALAQREGAQGLVTGENLGQVSSQTIENIGVVDELATAPVLRPLIGFNKQEIVDIAREIGTYSISILPDQDCCSLFVPRHPVTRADPGRVHELEAGLPVDELVKQALAQVEVKEFQFPKAAIPGVEPSMPRPVSP